MRYTNNDSYTDAASRQKINEQFMLIERMRDFIGWLFDNPDDEGIHWMNESEAWELFEKWEDRTYGPPLITQNKNPQK